MVSSSKGRLTEEVIMVVPKVRLEILVVEVVRTEAGVDWMEDMSGVKGIDWNVFSVAKLPAREVLSRGKEEVDKRGLVGTVD